MFFLATIVLLTSIPASAEPMRRTVGADWTWFTDYAYLSAVWTLNSEDGCELEVGYGISFRGKPRGGTQRFSSYLLLDTYGIGAIKVRVVGAGPPCIVQLDQGDVGTIPIFGEPSVLDAAGEDAERAVEAHERKQENVIGGED